MGWRHVPPRRASPPGYRRGDLTDSPRYQTPHMATRSRSRRVLRTPYRFRHRPATRRCGLILKSARVAGLAAAATDPALRKLHAWVSTALHPDRYGLRRFSCRSGISSASAPARCVASSLRSCAHADVSTSPVWQPPSHMQSACHNAGRGRGSRASGARSLRVDTRPSPHARRPDRLPHAAPARLIIYYRLKASMVSAAPVKRGDPPSRKCRSPAEGYRQLVVGQDSPRITIRFNRIERASKPDLDVCVSPSSPH